MPLLPAHKHEWQAVQLIVFTIQQDQLLWACRCGVHEWRDSKEVA